MKFYKTTGTVTVAIEAESFDEALKKMFEMEQALNEVYGARVRVHLKSPQEEQAGASIV